jgi:hypothetical protein
MIFNFRRFGLRGRNTIASPSTRTSSGSPARKPNFARNGFGSTTCPLVEILVSMVRPSYPDFPDRTTFQEYGRLHRTLRLPAALRRHFNVVSDFLGCRGTLICFRGPFRGFRPTRGDFHEHNHFLFAIANVGRLTH